MEPAQPDPLMNTGRSLQGDVALEGFLLELEIREMLKDENLSLWSSDGENDAPNGGAAKKDRDAPLGGNQAEEERTCAAGSGNISVTVGILYFCNHDVRGNCGSFIFASARRNRGVCITSEKR